MQKRAEKHTKHAEHAKHVEHATPLKKQTKKTPKKHVYNVLKHAKQANYDFKCLISIKHANMLIKSACMLV